MSGEFFGNLLGLLRRDPPKTTWRDELGEFGSGSSPLFTPALIEAVGDRPWQPGKADREAAALFHIELNSRISTQEIGYSSGVETAALDSLRALFDRARAICRDNLEAETFEILAWFVLNHHVRPFTSRWHRRADAGGLRALDDTDDFRLHLAIVRTNLRRFDELLLNMRGDGPGPSVEAEEFRAVQAEMAQPLPWGINRGDPGGLEGVGGLSTSSMDAAERKSVMARRSHYDLSRSADWASGIALSGGGIRSATFGLGVLSVFAERGLLKQFDYLSTVSGGGYLGAFLTNYLASGPEEAARGVGDSNPVGLNIGERPFENAHRDSSAVGHIRQNCRYLASAPARERLQSAFAQAGGLLTNLVALAALACLCASGFMLVDAGVTALTSLYSTSNKSVPVALVAAAPLIGLLLLSPALTRFVRGSAPWSDVPVAISAAPLAAVAAAALWREALGYYGSLVSSGLSAAAGVLAVPLGVLLVGVTLERMLPRGRAVAIWIARAAAPTFLLAAVLTFAHVVTTFDWARWGLPLGSLAVTLYFFLVLDLNRTGLHRRYRNALAEAFLVVDDAVPGQVRIDGPRRLSTLASSALGPYPIINAALNVPASKQPLMRGRLTDFFCFTPHHCGSPITGYHPTTDWERAEPDLNLATAMAISGAAISPRMGLQNRPQLSFWLSLLNLRLGYWLRKPGKAWGRFSARASLPYLIKELTGSIDETSKFLNLSDGGHIENLGVYELLRRRCKFIVAVDGEQDQGMTFHAIANLQRLASIDLGVRIDIDLDALRLDERGLSRSHFQFCRIHYGPSEIGYLVYLKLSLTGNEGEFLRRFRLDEPDFPHHPTADQNFTEARFEAYRSLGQHVGEKLFLESIVPAVAAGGKEIDLDRWFGALGRSFLDARPGAESDAT